MDDASAIDMVGLALMPAHETPEPPASLRAAA
jgi:hypothetical protein